jgi:hypothetical protein
MSLESFQRALCDLIASPKLCLELRAQSEAVLSRYELSERERLRLNAVVWQRGMSTNCSLYRSNRITPIYTLLHYTCIALGSQFPTLIDEFWEVQNYRDGQLKSESERFGDFLRERIASGVIASPFAGELLDFELAKAELEFAPPATDTHVRSRLVRFRHDPIEVLGAAAREAIPLHALPEVDALVMLRLVDGSVRIDLFSGA